MSDQTNFGRFSMGKNPFLGLKCGSRHVIEELCDAYDMAQPDPILRANEHDAHAAAGVLKQYLRELPEPVIPYRQYDRLKATGYLIEDGQDLKPIIDQLECLPAPNYCLLQFLCQLLSEFRYICQRYRKNVF
ncbi:unnamed protein product [Hydatigera taeniaeformis]|uniref:Rho-GAP domain-containing protein n=1 Tax=Hydatigena taeniaeformis TaxID=6205 RepID=A0A0R3WJU1_HYDTA|nr:unnamed protein product [Hydatigera taeniaeformis]